MDQLPHNFVEARRLLLRTKPFYGFPVFATPVEFTEAIPTAATSGTKLYINPKFIHRMPVPHVAAILAHESIHIIRADPDMMARAQWTDGTKIQNIRKLNRALDYWINMNLIDDEHMQFPTAAGFAPLYDPGAFKGKTVKEIYHLLPDQPQDSGGSGQGLGGIGAGDDIEVQPMSSEERANHVIKINQALEAARSQGRLPGWAEQFVKKLKSPKIQFRDLLDAWLHDTFSKEDLSYRRLNRHYMPDFFMPSAVGLTFGRVDIFMDTSGSCWDQAPLFLSLVNKALKQLRPVDSYLYMFDDGLKGEPAHFGPGENLDYTKVKVVGNGGTNFIPIFDHIQKNQIQTDGVIVLTDLLGTFPKSAPPYPTLWVSIYKGKQAPFGRTFYLKHGEEDLED